MLYYRPVRFVNGMLRRVITDEDGNIIKDPTDEQLRLAILGEPKIDMLKGRKCCECGSSKTHVSGYSHKWYKHICTKECCTGYVCLKCYSKQRNNLPDSNHGIIKSMRKFRNGKLSKGSSSGKGFIGEMIVAKTRKLKSCAIETDNFNNRFDLSVDPEYGNIQVKLRTPQHGDYKVSFGIEHNFDTLFVVCMSEDMKDIEKMYVIPEEELCGITQITICKNGGKYEIFRVDKTPYNDMFHSMKLENCHILESD